MCRDVWSSLRRPEERSTEGPSSATKPPTPVDEPRGVPPASPDGEFLLPRAGAVDIGVRWEPSKSPIRLAEEDTFIVAVLMVADSAEGGAEVESRAPADPVRSSPVAGGARGQPIILSEGSAEAVVVTAQKGRAPEAPAAELADPAAGLLSRLTAAEGGQGATPSVEAVSALVLAPGGAGSSNALLEVMGRAELWSQMVRSDGLKSNFDGAALDAAKSAIDAVKAQVD